MFKVAVIYRFEWGTSRHSKSSMVYFLFFLDLPRFLDFLDLPRFFLDLEGAAAEEEEPISLLRLLAILSASLN